MKKILAGVAGVVSLVALLLGATLQLARPDLLHAVLAGAFGSRRSAILWLYVLGLLIAGPILRSRRPWNVARTTLGASAIAALALLVFHLLTFSRHFSIETVAYSSTDGTPIEASLYLPKTRGPHAAMSVVHGSAPIRRGAYEALVERFVRAGYAVLIADKRGVGGTGGTFDTQDNTGPENIERLVSDAVAGVRLLASHPAIRGDAIGLIGISQAGWVAPLAAVRDTSVRFLLLVSAPTVSTREENVWSNLRGDHSGNAIVSLREAEQIIDTVSRRGVDARPPLAELTIPGLWLFGSDDNSIPSRKSIRVLDSLNASGGAMYSHRLYEGTGHGLVTRRGALLPRMTPRFAPDAIAWLDSIVER